MMAVTGERCSWILTLMIDIVADSHFKDIFKSFFVLVSKKILNAKPLKFMFQNQHHLNVTTFESVSNQASHSLCDWTLSFFFSRCLVRVI